MKLFLKKYRKKLYYLNKLFYKQIFMLKITHTHTLHKSSHTKANIKLKLNMHRICRIIQRKKKGQNEEGKKEKGKKEKIKISGMCKVR